MTRATRWATLGFAFGLIPSAAAATGGDVDEWIPIVMSASAILFGGGSLWKVASVAREFGRLEQKVNTTLDEVNRLRDRTVLGDRYSAEMGAVEVKLREMRESLERMRDR